MTHSATVPSPVTAAWQPPPGSYRITRTFDFAAAHHLDGMPDGHRCARNHGHTWTIEVTLSSTRLVGPGWVADFADLNPLGAFIEDTLDHRDLNEVLPAPPTSELLAAFLADWCIRHLETRLGARLESIVVSEGGANRVEFRPDRRRAQ
ncbi:6-pyruvoyl trahydropterin synthase family protein [Amycolatopsis cihanbeyliensis]|uniref:6-carboxy-5,6,7,8-tetrahydropterin synthase n=1 Tax=Amycolatopsis cihanbeyliensis TaxID=1128664 RepID=A0A542DPU0_AMYCI|nr:6-carboxytetrahydropterin synthase [Amycolatopsis cihanbeyliensis]TQJ05087.1 6-pyruvoyltetrahydropterin/6-carboxytetrahydropterin synthase [Amycolatopsis cihanbeyliensis]